MKINELALAELRHDMRLMYKQIGVVGAFQVLYELLMSAQILMEVIVEELTNEKK